MLSMVVDEQGNPQRIAIIRPLGHGLDEKAIAAVSQWQLQPSSLQGVPVAVEINVEVTFKNY